MLGFPEPAAIASDPNVTALELPIFALVTEPIPESASVSPPCKLSNVGVNTPPDTFVVPSYSLDKVAFKVLGLIVTFVVAPANVKLLARPVPLAKASVLLFVIVCVPALANPRIPEPVNKRLSPLTPEEIVKIELSTVVVLS